jgi:hypothetical protein
VVIVVGSDVRWLNALETSTSCFHDPFKPPDLAALVVIVGCSDVRRLLLTFATLLEPRLMTRAYSACISPSWW